MKSTKLLTVLVIVSASLVMQNAIADYVAYSVGSKEKSPLPETVDNVDTKYLLNIEWGEYSGRIKRRIDCRSNELRAQFPVE